MTTDRPRLRVTPQSSTEQRWHQYGRPYFLNRSLYQRHTGARRMLPLPTRLFSAAPVLDAVVALTILLVPLWALWRFTQWACPPATELVRWLGRQTRQLVRSFLRWLHRVAWRRPAERYGLAVAVWLCLTALITLTGVLALASGDWLALLGLVPWVALVVGLWFALRWWRQRLYRPRPLPGRRRRNGHG